MDRRLNSIVSAAVEKPITEPTHLVEIQFNAVTVYYSSRGTISWDGRTWQESGVKLRNLRVNENGSVTGQLSVVNHDFSLSALILGQVLTGVPCKVYLHYGTDAVMRFDGFIDGAPEIGARILLNIVSLNAWTLSVPRMLCAPPVFTHLPPAGSTIEWGGEVFEFRTTTR